MSTIQNTALNMICGNNHSQTTGFKRCTFAQLKAASNRPAKITDAADLKAAKAKAPICAPHDGDAKTKDSVLAHDRFTMLWADIDGGNHTLADIQQQLADLGICSYAVYATASSKPDDQRWRVLVEIDQPIDFEYWYTLQSYLMDKLNGDDCATRPQQILYLPFKWEQTAHYEHATGDGEPLDVAYSPLVLAAIEHRERLDKEAEEQAAAAPKAEPKGISLSEGQISPVGAYNEAHDWPELFKQYGFRKVGRRYLHPNSTSGAAGVVLLDDRYCSNHGCDPLNDGHTHDAFDLFVEFEHGGDFDAAVKAAGEMLRTPEGVTINKHNQRAHMAAQAAESAAAEFEHMNEDATEEPSTGEAVDLISPPGIVGDLCHLMKLSARRERPELYPAAALQLLALLSEGRQSQYTKRLNLITLAIAVTGAGKESVQEVVKELALNLKASRRIYADPGSFKEMIENLIDADGRKLYIIDEIHSLFNSMKSNKAATYETKMEAEFLKMTTTNLYTFRGREKRTVIESLGQKLKAIEKALENMSTEGDEISEKALRFMQTKAKIERHIEYIDNGWPNPFLSVMGHSVPERLDQIASDPENIASGFIGRSIVIRCPERAEALKLDLPEYEISILKAELVERLARIQYNKTQITATDEADRFIRERVAYWDAEEQRNNDHLGAIYRRAPEHLPKLASLLAVESGIITIEHARYAAAMVEQSISDIRYLLVQALAKKAGASEALQMESTRLAILKNFKGRGKVSKDDIKKKVTRKKEWQELQDKEPQRDLFEELISRMVEGGQLEYTKEGRKERYQVINK